MTLVSIVFKIIYVHDLVWRTKERTYILDLMLFINVGLRRQGLTSNPVTPTSPLHMPNPKKEKKILLRNSKS